MSIYYVYRILAGVLQQSMRVAGEELRPRLVAEEDVPPSDDDLPASVSQNHLNQKRKLSLAEEDEHDSDIADGKMHFYRFINNATV